MKKEEKVALGQLLSQIYPCIEDIESAWVQAYSLIVAAFPPANSESATRSGYHMLKRQHPKALELLKTWHRNFFYENFGKTVDYEEQAQNLHSALYNVVQVFSAPELPGGLESHTNNRPSANDGLVNAKLTLMEKTVASLEKSETDFDWFPAEFSDSREMLKTHLARMAFSHNSQLMYAKGGTRILTAALQTLEKINGIPSPKILVRGVLLQLERLGICKAYKYHKNWLNRVKQAQGEKEPPRPKPLHPDFPKLFWQ